MNQDVQNAVTCGVYLISVNTEGKDNACIANTFTMVAIDPPTYMVSLSKMSRTCEMIVESREFTVTILSKDADKHTICRFGHQSGAHVDKLKGFKDAERVETGAFTLVKGACAYINLKVEKKIDLGSHYMFICKPLKCKRLSDEDPMTYAYYYKKIKPAIDKMPNETGKRYVWRCECGHEYEGCEIPKDYVCPTCGKSADSFERMDNYCC